MALLLILVLLGAAIPAFALDTVSRNGKLYLADWSEGSSTAGEKYEYSTWRKYFVLDDGEVPTGWFKDAKGSWHFADSEGYIRTPWSKVDSQLNSIVIPAEVDGIDIEELSGIGKNTVLYVTPGSYGERFARANAFPYDNGVKRVVGTGITNEDEKVKWIIDNYIEPGMSVLEKARVLHDWITRNARYDLTYSRYESRDILIDQDGVCDAHARAYAKLLEAAGLEGRYISGDTPSGGHAWNLLKVNGIWYHVDTTWDNPVHSTEKVAVDNSPEFSGMEGYHYFVLGDQEISSNHTWTDTFIRDNNPYGFKLVDGKIIYSDEATGEPVVGWKTVLDTNYQYDTKALKLIEDAQLKRYHFSTDGNMQKGWQNIDGNRYMFNQDGSMVRGEWSDENDKAYYFDRSGRLQVGTFWANNHLLRSNENGQILTGFYQENGLKHLYTDNSEQADHNNAGNGSIYFEGAEYQLDGENTVVTGIVENEGTTLYYGEDGQRTKGWAQRDDGWSYFYNSLLTGGYYHLNKDGLDGWFSFDENGILEDCRNDDWGHDTAFSFPDATQHIHEKEIIPGKEATLTQPGLTRGVRCSVCGQVLSAQTVIPAFSQVACFVDRCYDKILNRGSDESGLSYWTDNLEMQYMTASTVISGFVNSNEFMHKPLTNAERVETMYHTMLDRSSDPAGKAYWVSRLDTGMSINSIAAGFSQSNEFAEICKNYNIDNGSYDLTEYRDKNFGVTGFVNRCYDKALSRNPDTDGLNYWCGKLLDKNMTAQQVAHGFIDSQEMKDSNLSNEDYVTRMYELFLDREPDQDGFQYWTEKLAAGESRGTIEEGFAQSVEFGDIVAGYGIE